MKTVSYSILLFVFWLLLSGHFDPLLIGLGLASVAVAVILSRRMNVIDHESYPIHLTAKFPAFLVYIFGEIFKANIDVIKRILSLKKNPISPQWVDIPVQKNSDMGRVIYANSITLTPGTVSVELTQDKVTVHALTKESAEELASGKMAKAIPDQDNST